MKPTIKSLILAVCLFGISAFAGEEPGCLRVKEIQAEYNALAKGTTLSLQLKFNTHGCHLPVDSLSTVSFTANTPSNFALIVGQPDYDKIKQLENHPGERIAGDMVLPVYVTMSGNVAPGRYEITAALNYSAIDDQGDRTQQQIPVIIPVKVVASQAEVHHIEKHDPWKPLKITGVVAASIVAAPVVFTLWLVQTVTGIEILPDC
jgi:hypothetical protein